MNGIAPNYLRKYFTELLNMHIPCHSIIGLLEVPTNNTCVNREHVSTEEGSYGMNTHSM